jgi:hypothetical protein
VEWPLAASAFLRRVDSWTGAQLVGRKGGDYAGIAIPYFAPGDRHVREYRLRRDHPDLEADSSGQLKVKQKYLSPPGRSNMLYLPPGCDSALLGNADLPLIITEGEFKTLAADCCLILEDPQGSRKSTALKTLAGPYFADELADLGTKDSALQTQGVWIIELSELDSLGRAEVSRIKAFMSRTTDRFRPPYGNRLIESPRQCVFAGSVNHSSYLRDDSGGRRFRPVACGRIDIDRLARDRDQLWAEAKALFRARLRLVVGDSRTRRHRRCGTSGSLRRRSLGRQTRKLIVADFPSGYRTQYGNCRRGVVDDLVRFKLQQASARAHRQS